MREYRYMEIIEEQQISLRTMCNHDMTVNKLL